MTRTGPLEPLRKIAVLAGSFASLTLGAAVQAQDQGEAGSAEMAKSLSSMLVTPLRVDLPGSGTGETVHVRNNTSAPMAIQVRLFTWTQQGAAESHAPSNDLLVSPSIVSIPAGQTQIVRVMRKAASSPDEKRYRLVIDQLPDPAQAKAGSAVTRIRFALPVFVDSDKASPAKLEWHMTDGELQLKNSGGAAARIVRIDVKGADGRAVPVEQNSLRYVFGSNAIAWPIGKGCSFGKVHVTAHIDGQTVDAEPTATCG